MTAAQSLIANGLRAARNTPTRLRFQVVTGESHLNLVIIVGAVGRRGIEGKNVIIVCVPNAGFNLARNIVV